MNNSLPPTRRNCVTGQSRHFGAFQGKLCTDRCLLKKYKKKEPKKLALTRGSNANISGAPSPPSRARSSFTCTGHTWAMQVLFRHSLEPPEGKILSSARSPHFQSFQAIAQCYLPSWEQGRTRHVEKATQLGCASSPESSSNTPAL